MAATLQSRCFTSPSSSSRPRIACTRASLRDSADRPSYLYLPNLPLFPANEGNLVSKGREQEAIAVSRHRPRRAATVKEDVGRSTLSKFYAILEAVADRAEMHAIIGAQRDNWNTLLLGSVNSATLAAALMAGLSAATAGKGSPSFLAFKLSSTLLYAAATGMMAVVNKIQPSQLVEEQRNAARLFRQLGKGMETTLSLRSPTATDVGKAMDRVLALDKAYPLPLLGGMLDKFPKTVQPTVWWPKVHHHVPPHGRRTAKGIPASVNGWNEDLEKEMEGVLEALKRKDIAEYVKVGKLVLKINRVLALSGPLLTGLAAVAVTAMDASRGPWPVLVGVVGGVLATVVNTVEHGGQVGMVFELFRNLAGYNEQLEEMIESN